MKLFLTIFICFLSASANEQDASPDRKRNYQFIIGAGAGTESGMGLHLGLLKGRHSGQMGVGFLYGENADIFYSFGLRYLHFVYYSRLNNTYAWTGGSMTGDKMEDSHDYFLSYGLGMGVDYHFGLPLHFQVDLGFRLMYDHNFIYDSEPGFHLGPSVNGSITYHW